MGRYGQLIVTSRKPLQISRSKLIEPNLLGIPGLTLRFAETSNALLMSAKIDPGLSCDGLAPCAVRARKMVTDSEVDISAALNWSWLGWEACGT